MKSVLIYYPFALASKADSGSKLRPIEMIKAFETWGEQEDIKVIVISGESAERAAKFRQLKAQGELDDLLFCYVENQTIPVWLTDKNHIPKRPTIDWEVFRFLKQRQVPMGVFYRDVYWKFDELYPLKGWKRAIMRTVYKLEEKFLQTYAKAIFLPSTEMGRFVQIDLPKVALPPGGKTLSAPHTSTTGLNGIYVGGISHADYGFSLLLDSCEQVRKNGTPFTLTIVCRKEEVQAISSAERSRMEQLDVRLEHLSGKELKELYREMNFAFIPRYPSTYNNFSVPVKLVEYLSNRLPVIATNCKAQQELIESGPYGIICEATADSMATAIQAMIENQAHYQTQIERHFLQHHSWLARVRTVANTLLGEAKL